MKYERMEVEKIELRAKGIPCVMDESQTVPPRPAARFVGSSPQRGYWPVYARSSSSPRPDRVASLRVYAGTSRCAMGKEEPEPLTRFEQVGRQLSGAARREIRNRKVHVIVHLGMNSVHRPWRAPSFFYT
jgi:hypothetical protein